MLQRYLDAFSSEHTRRAYRSDLSDFFDIREGGTLEAKQVEAVSKRDIRSHIQSLQDEGRSVSTCRRRLSALRRFFDWAVDEGIAGTNPARNARIDLSQPSITSADDRPPGLTKSEVENLYAATDEAGETAVRDRGLLMTILYGALRRAEVAAIDVEDVRPLGRHWVIDLSSGGAYVKIPEIVVEAIDAVQDRYGIDRGALWRSLSNRNRGARMTPDAIYKVVRRTGRRAGISELTVEQLRQTGLQLALQAGASVQQVQLHARLQSAASVERHLDPDEQSGRLHESAVDYIDVDPD